MLVMPGIRMLGTMYKLAEAKDKELIEKNIRKNFRTFCTLPWTSPNELVDLLLGDIKVNLEGLATITDYKSACRLNHTVPNRDFTRSVKAEVRDIPRIATRLIKLMYGNKCR
jgi:hypothetical protein